MIPNNTNGQCMNEQVCRGFVCTTANHVYRSSKTINHGHNRNVIRQYCFILILSPSLFLIPSLSRLLQPIANKLYEILKILQNSLDVCGENYVIYLVRVSVHRRSVMLHLYIGPRLHIIYVARASNNIICFYFFSSFRHNPFSHFWIQ